MPKQSTCTHPSKQRTRVTYGVYECEKCGENLNPDRLPEYRLSERVTITSGDLIKVKGVGMGVFLYAEVDTPSGVDGIHFAELEAGRWGKLRTVYPDRVRRAPKSSIARHQQ